MEINNKVGWLLIIVVAVVIAFFVWKRSAPKEGAEILPPGVKGKGAEASKGAGGDGAASEGGLVVYFGG